MVDQFKFPVRQRARAKVGRQWFAGYKHSVRILGRIGCIVKRKSRQLEIPDGIHVVHRFTLCICAYLNFLLRLVKSIHEPWPEICDGQPRMRIYIIKRQHLGVYRRPGIPRCINVTSGMVVFVERQPFVYKIVDVRALIILCDIAGRAKYVETVIITHLAFGHRRHTDIVAYFQLYHLSELSFAKVQGVRRFVGSPLCFKRTGHLIQTAIYVTHGKCQRRTQSYKIDCHFIRPYFAGFILYRFADRSHKVGRSIGQRPIRLASRNSCIIVAVRIVEEGDLLPSHDPTLKLRPI